MMRNMLSIAVAAALAVVAASSTGQAVETLQLTSSAFSNQGMIPAQYTCDGRSQSPPLQWSNVPAGTRSFAVLVDDPDAPGGTYEHLVMFNLPATARSLPSEPAGSAVAAANALTAKNDSGRTGYTPICPPSGRHHYRFQVLALDRILPLPEGASSRAVADALQGHVLARGDLIGVYQRGMR